MTLLFDYSKYCFYAVLHRSWFIGQRLKQESNHFGLQLFYSGSNCDGGNKNACTQGDAAIALIWYLCQYHTSSLRVYGKSRLSNPSPRSANAEYPPSEATVKSEQAVAF